MTSNRRRSINWSSSRTNAYQTDTTFYIEHYCPACDKWNDEVTDSEWRPEGEELCLGTCGCIE